MMNQVLGTVIGVIIGATAIEVAQKISDRFFDGSTISKINMLVAFLIAWCVFVVNL